MEGDKNGIEGLTESGLPPAEERPHRPRGVSAFPVLMAFGVLFFVLALSLRAFEELDSRIGFDRFVATALGFLFLYTAWVSKDLGRLRERLLDLTEEILKVFYGPDFRRQRQAIDILIKALNSDNESVRSSSQSHLERLTGLQLGSDPEAWAQWWESNRSSFRAKDQGETDASS